jgi:hypothetical protein
MEFFIFALSDADNYKLEDRLLEGVIFRSLSQSSFLKGLLEVKRPRLQVKGLWVLPRSPECLLLPPCPPFNKEC